MFCKFGKIVDGGYTPYVYPIDVKTGTRIFVPDNEIYNQGWKKVLCDMENTDPEDKNEKMTKREYFELGEDYIIEKVTYIDKN